VHFGLNTTTYGTSQRFEVFELILTEFLLVTANSSLVIMAKAAKSRQKIRPRTIIQDFSDNVMANIARWKFDHFSHFLICLSSALGISPRWNCIVQRCKIVSRFSVESNEMVLLVDLAYCFRYTFISCNITPLT
jgi:hypothetical protein